MQKVELKIACAGAVICLSKGCSFKRECATHSSAGDFRSEDGFTPQLIRIGKDYFCATYDSPVDDTIEYTNLPQNYNELGRGILTIKDIEKESVNNFQI